MKKFEFKTLKTELELAEFSRCYSKAFEGKRLRSLHGVKVSKLKEYSHVIAVSSDGELVAGYVINQYPWRCFEDVRPEQIENTIHKLGGEKNICELVAIWKASSMTSLAFLLKVWPRILLDTFRLGKARYIFGCAYRGHGMAKNYLLLSPKLIRQGEHANDLNVFYYSRGLFLGTVLFGTVFGLISKVFKTKKRSSVARTEPVLEREIS